jgi:quercetin dioxygenase-like cupin family protein
MKNVVIIIHLVISILVSFQTTAQSSEKPLQGNWSKGSSERFFGDVWVEYFINDSESDFLASRVLFEPKARSNWHKHTGKQIIFGVDGEGYFKEKGKPMIQLKKGDLVEILPGVIHSHGSLNKQFIQGVMMNGISKKESTVWLNPVIEEELYEK